MKENPIALKFVKSLEKYKNNFILRGLFQFSLSLINPLFAGAAIGVETAVFTWQENRILKWEVIADELDNWEQLNEELLKNADFLHCFKKVIDATEQTQNHTKIRYFARVLKSSTITGSIPTIDMYEEYLSILEELSFREITILNILDKYERQFPQREDENDYSRSLRFWDRFTSELTEKIKIPFNQIDAVLTSLTRTGCYETFRGTYASPTGGQGKLTPIYAELKNLIENQPNKSSEEN